MQTLAIKKLLMKMQLTKISTMLIIQMLFVTLEYCMTLNRVFSKPKKTQKIRNIFWHFHTNFSQVEQGSSAF